MQKLQPVRGTSDLWGSEYQKHALVIKTAEELAATFGYTPIATPILEYTAVFKRSVGETSDLVVGKEMYTFEDRGGEEVTLRPEGTAGVVRALISNGLAQYLPLKLLYHGPMFRYERPQLGRKRQFHQVGVECLGIEHPLVDVETIALGARLLERLNILHRTQLQLNTLGDSESRNNYREALLRYFTPLASQLSEDSRKRLERNPLRILDSKAPQDQELTLKAPSFTEFLTSASQDFFHQVCEGLEDLGIPFEINRRLVRGLDYYNHTAFEFVTTDLGAQGAVLAGGRYDGLVAQLGGPSTPGIGWGLGIERATLLMADPQDPCPTISVIPVSPDQNNACFLLAMELRSHGLKIDYLYSGNLKKRLARANKIKASLALMMGEEEEKNHTISIKDLTTGHQEILSRDHLLAYLQNQ